MSVPASGRTVEQIKAETSALSAQIGALTAQVAPLLVEHVRAVVHALIPDACEVTLFASEWENGLFYSPGALIVSTDGTESEWDEIVEDANRDGADLPEGGGLNAGLLADLSAALGANPSHSTLVMDLVHLSGQPT